MERPYMICRMLTSLDGKIIGDFLNDVRTKYYTDESAYRIVHKLGQVYHNNNGTKESGIGNTTN